MSKKVIVFGSFVVDLMGRTPHLPASGETVKGSMFRMGALGAKDLIRESRLIKQARM